MNLKREFIFKSFNKEQSFTELCREYGISTKTGYKWKERFLEGGFPALEELSRKPNTNSKEIPESVSVELIRMKNLHRNWGASKILQIYKNNHPGEYAPARSTVENLFVRAGFVVPRKRKRYKTTERIQVKVVLDRIDPGCPYQNGGHERMHRDMKAELESQIDGNLNEHQKGFDKLREDFNTILPHEALGMKGTSDVYIKSV